MKKLLLVTAILFSFGQISAQFSSNWQRTSKNEISKLQRQRANINAAGELYFKLDLVSLKQSLQNIPDKFSNTPGVLVAIPNMNGGTEQYKVWENSNFDPELQAQFPDIRAYVGKGITDPQASINFSLSPLGIQTMVSRAGSGMEFIEAFDKAATSYVLFDSKNRNSGKLPFVCSTVDTNLNQELLSQSEVAHRSSNAVYKTMRLALSCTGEYGAYFGGTVTGALAGMNATMTRVNGVLENDLALHFNIIPSNTAIIFVNAATDPYSAAANMGNWNAELQAYLTLHIGSINYDIGHLFGATGGGGNAGCIGCVCSGGTKGSGITSPGSGGPVGDNFDIDYVVHEMGHQLGGNHSFTFGFEGSAAQVEPGSGSTIMGYAGITSYDVQAHSDALFAYKNIAQIQTNLAGKTCPVSVAMTNATPAVNAGTDYTIPKGTAFILTGTASDADASDVLTYLWEENDLGTSATTNATSKVSATKAVGPNFRTFAPVTTPVRYCPQLSKVLLGQLSTATNWESVYSGTANRNFNFTFTARDNHTGGGQTSTDAMVVTVDVTKGPFTVTSQSTTGISWAAGTQTITWTALAGATTTDILLSVNGGLTFPIVLATAVPDNGTADITVPNVNSTTCRIMVRPTGNIYYAVNSKVFAITSTATTPTFAAVAPVCRGAAMTDLPTTSTNSITGTWSPAVNNTATTTYIFEPTVGQNANTTSLTITVNQLTPPAFAAVPTICVGAALADLPTTSTNSYTGSWSPAIDNTATTTYTFTPDAGQCASTKRMTLIVNPILTPTFVARNPICSGNTLAALPFYSTNGVSGNWSPAINNTATTTYTFTPGGVGQCAVSTTMTIVVNQRTAPSFDAVAPICSGAALAPLPTTSNNGITGAWSPALDNTTTKTYTFTPGTTQCALPTTLDITVNSTAQPTGNSPQTYNAGDTVANLIVSGDNIQWYSDSQGTVAVTTDTPLQDGTIYYATQALNSCEGPTTGITAILLLKNNDFNSLALTYYPNPVTGLLYIKSAEMLQTIAVYNTLGQIIYKNKINAINAEVDLSVLAAGSYFIKVESGDKRNIFKIVKI